MTDILQKVIKNNHTSLKIHKFTIATCHESCDHDGVSCDYDGVSCDCQEGRFCLACVTLLQELSIVI